MIIISLHQAIGASNNSFKIDISTETIDEAIVNEDLENLVLNSIKSIRNNKNRPNCSIIYDYLSKLLPNSEINKKNISTQLEYLTNNNTLKNKLNSGKDSYFVVNETDQNIRIFLLNKFYVQ